MGNKKGKLIFIEGVDGCGKTTLINRLKEKYGDKIHFFREPGSTIAGDKIREILLSDEVDTCDYTDILLFTASRCELFDKHINSLLDNNEIVILDRSMVSTLVYQPMKYLFKKEYDKVSMIQDKIMRLHDFINFDNVKVYFLKEDSDTIVSRLNNRTDEINKRDHFDKATVEITQNMYEYVLNKYFDGNYFISNNTDIDSIIDRYLSEIK